MTMMTRRNFFLATAAGAAVLSRSTNLFAATYDLIIKGGHVIDPSLRTAASAEPPHPLRRIGHGDDDRRRQRRHHGFTNEQMIALFVRR
jgi:hypothetical protein